MKSNVEVWRALHERDYFAHHPCYVKRDFNRDDAVRALRWLGPLRKDMRVAVVGCGYGRETAGLAPHVGHVWGIDVSTKILDEAVAYLGVAGVANFTPVLAEGFEANLPAVLDAFFSFNVFQHLTRDLAKHYFTTLGARLAPGGGAVVQFLQSRRASELDDDAPVDIIGEPSVSWSCWQLFQLAAETKLHVEEIRSQQINPNALWHWAIVRKSP